MTTAEFAKYYSTVSDEQLIDIIDNPDQYQDEALKAARSEFESRNLPEAAADAIRQEKLRIAENLREGKERNIERTAVITKVGSQIAAQLSPFQIAELSVKRQINTITIGLCVMFISTLSAEFSSLTYFISNLSDIDPFSFIYLFLFITCPVGIFLFYRRKILGWFLIAVFSASEALFAILRIYQTVISSETYTGGLIFNPYFVRSVFYLLIFGGLTIALMRHAIRNEYNVDKNWMLFAALISGLFVFVAAFS